MEPIKKAAMTKEAAMTFSLEQSATGTRADFRFAPLNAFLLVAIFVVGLVAHLYGHEFSVGAVYLTLGSALVLALVIRVFQVWEAVLISEPPAVW